MQVRVKYGSDWVWESRETIPDVTATVISAVVAAASILRLLHLFAPHPVTLPADLLLPLTTAAGGPGSSLTKLVVTAAFSPAATAVAKEAPAGRLSRGYSSMDWSQGLKQLATCMVFHHSLRLRQQPTTLTR